MDRPTESFARLTERLSEASVRRRWEAYRAIDWDDPTMAVDPVDPRWALPGWDPLGASDWYRDQAPEQRSLLGLYRVAAFLKIGIEFETVLAHGLLNFASTLANGNPAFRYVYHEISEEAQHSLMFQELINRSGMDVPSSPETVGKLYDQMAQAEPAMLFLAALAGEEVFDHWQRRILADAAAPPLLMTIARIHIAEEARHLSFARALLHDVVPTLDERQGRLLRYRAPFAVDWMAGHVFGPGPVLSHLVDGWGMPGEVRESIATGPAADDLRRRSVARLVRFCHDVGIVDDRLSDNWASLSPRHLVL